ncbi:SDR family oxidoreductase [Priestia megaterium]|uniref:SDR family NAD(P)-dependent oxidoreductase n=1 Tax=Priestia megaterium TaxID=1404 RepID=UPI003012A697
MLNKKTVLVTGANSGIGFATVNHFLELNYEVIAIDKNSHNLSELTNNKKFTSFIVDLSKEIQVNSLIEELNTSFTYPDILINAAGIREITPVLDLSTELFNKVINVNLVAPFILSRELCRAWIRQGKRGTIINIASVSGVMAEPERAAYVSSKHAIIGLTKQMAMEFGAKGIRINSISPGVIRTELTEEYFQDENLVSLIRNNHALHTWGEPEDIVSCIEFLSSEQSKFITGSNFVIDGGWTAGKKL